jgi:hypothetical protein
LDSCTLELSAKGIRDGYIDLWSIERAITWIQLPLGATGRGECVQSTSKLIFGDIPCLDVTKVLLRAGRKIELEGEAEGAIYGIEEVEKPFDFLANL